MSIKTYFPDGITTMFDSDNVNYGVCLGMYTIAAGASFSKTYALLVGAVVHVVDTFGTQATGVTVEYPSGYPVVSAGVVGYVRYIVIWATGTPTITTGPGMQALNADGSCIALSPSARGLNYLGKATYASTVSSVGAPNVAPTGEPGATLGRVKLRISAVNMPLGVMRVTGGRYARMSQFTQVSPGLWECGAQCIEALPTTADSAWPTLLVPDVYCFAIPLAPQAGAECSIYDTQTGELAYDLLAGKLLVSAGVVTVPAGLTVRDVVLPGTVTTSQLGVFGAPSWESVAGASAGAGKYQMQRQTAMWALSGSSLRRQNVMVATWKQDGPSGTYGFDNPSVVELINLTLY